MSVILFQALAPTGEQAYNRAFTIQLQYIFGQRKDQ